MKKIFFTITLIGIFITGCKETKINNDNFSTDSLSYNIKDAIAEVCLEADYPITNNKILNNAIAEFISEELGGTYDGDLSNSKEMINHYGNNLYMNLENNAKEFNIQDMPTLVYSQSIKMVNETEKYITYIADTYIYLGGAHGMSTKQGSTFRKSDGRRFSYDMLKDTESAEFKQIIKKGLKKYFTNNGIEITDDESLAQMLITESDINYLPQPDFAPYLTKDSLIFIYQQYEIAPYSAGMPYFTVSFSEMLPYMTNTAKEYIEK